MACKTENGIGDTEAEEFNLTSFLNASIGNLTASSHPHPGSGLQPHDPVSNAITRYIIPSVLSFGIVGNTLNLGLFGHRFGFRGHHLELLERSALAGLTALALSDLLFCVIGVLVVALPRPVPGSTGVSPDGSGLMLVSFYYSLYKHALQNWFLFTSTWLTVVISLERFVVVGRPLKARWHLRARNSVIIYLFTFVVGGIVSLPLFLRHHVVRMSCPRVPSCTCNYVLPRAIFLHTGFRALYNVFWIVCGHVVPTVILAVANGRLLWVLYRSRARGIANPARYGCTSITVTVIAIVFSFLLLVCPSMVFESIYLLSVVSGSGVERLASGFRMAIAITNLMQAVKFSVNFLLYCGVLKQFRKTINDVATCQKGNSRLESLRSSAKPTPL